LVFAETRCERPQFPIDQRQDLLPAADFRLWWCRRSIGRNWWDDEAASFDLSPGGEVGVAKELVEIVKT
jgi:hypothetical protein